MPSRATATKAGFGVAVLAAAAVWATTATGAGPTPANLAPSAPEHFAAALENLRVAPDTNAPGYDRQARFQDGKGWPYTAPGCDERDQIMVQDMTAVAYKPGSTCNVAAGTLDGVFVPDVDHNGVDIDHVIPLKLAWDSGAASWTDERRRAFATDPGELRAERSAGNRGNGAEGPEASDPGSGGSDRCQYAQRYVTTALKWDLSVTAARQDALRRLLGTCP